MSAKINLDEIRDYFADKLKTFGATPRGVDWNSETSQDNRFAQLARVIQPTSGYSLLDYGSGYGAFYDYLVNQGHSLDYCGFDIVEKMVETGRDMHRGNPRCTFTADENQLPQCDYAVASGIFNIRLDTPYEDWTAYVLKTLTRMHELTRRGFSFNLLTSYSDPEYKRPDLYYADPLFYFDHTKKGFSRNVALLHDYGLYDFTVLVRKDV